MTRRSHIRRSLPALALSLLLALLAAAPGCGPAGKRNPAANSAASPDSVAMLEARADAWADSVMKGMSLQLRVGQLFMPAVFTSSDAQTLFLISEYADRLGVGGIVLLRGDVESAAHIADSISVLASCPLFIAVDAETGLSMRFSDAPEFLWNSQIDADVDPDALDAYGYELARECRLAGINMVLGPVLDVVPDSLAAYQGAATSRLRSFGNDPGRVALLGVAYASGLERGGVISVAKHFPGHGSASADSHRSLAVVGRPAASLEAVDLLPFRKYVDAGLSAVMVGHIYSVALDSVRRPAAFSPAVMTDLLRGRMKFNGLILTDAVNMQGADGFSPIDAIRAGADIILAPRNTEHEIAALRDSVEEGRLPRSVIDDRCRRILKYKYLKGIYCRRRAAVPGAPLRDQLQREAAPVRSRLKVRGTS